MLASGINIKNGLEEFDKNFLIASHFGFVPIKAPKITPQDTEIGSSYPREPHYDASEKAAFIRTYLENNFSSLPHPLALAYKRNLPRNKGTSYSLHMVGTNTGVAEALLMRTALSILKDNGHKHLQLDINCIGDKESIGAYERELLNHAKRTSPELAPELREELKKDAFSIFRSRHPELVYLSETAPSAVTSLSYQSRSYFKEVMEYVEAMELDFRLAPELVGERNHASHTIFAVRSHEWGNPEEPLAVGYRYSRLTRPLGFKKEVPMAGVTIFNGLKELGKKIYKSLPKPKFFIVQLGQEAKRKTLAILENLRENHIPVHHHLGKDKLAVQLANAENLNVSHLIIIGQKEALDDTATVRNITTRAQDTIPRETLPQYLKNIPF